MAPAQSLRRQSTRNVRLEYSQNLGRCRTSGGRTRPIKIKAMVISTMSSDNHIGWLGIKH